MEMTSATEKSLLENKLREIEFQKGRVEREKLSLEGELAVAQKEIIGLKCSMAEMSSASAGLRAELDTLRLQLQAKEQCNTQLTIDLSSAKALIEDLQVMKVENKKRR